MIGWVFMGLGGSVILIALSYAVVRVGSVAHFRTRWEYRAKIRQQGEGNGKKW